MFSEKNLINDDNSFRKFINFCLDENIISIDTEFVRNKTFYPTLCLLQVGTSKGSYAIDPDKITNILLLKKILRNKNILKIFHSPRQDIEIFFNLFGSLPNNIFDTQIAYSFISNEYQISYEKLVLKILKIKLDKSFQYYDWSLRPISRNMLNYALNDVYYLRKIYFKIEKKLRIKNRFDWAMEESKNYLNKKLYVNFPEDYWKNIYPSKAKNL
ncbi:ribonuclease D, partial [Alphaproteobacteria bacterium]|nr:ribonuclease D [Alphaproteobacteria bacterium]